MRRSRSMYENAGRAQISELERARRTVNAGQSLDNITDGSIYRRLAGVGDDNRLGVASVGLAAFTAYRALSNQPISPGSPTLVQFNAKAFDDRECFDTTSNWSWVAPEACRATFSAGVILSSLATTKTFYLVLFVNDYAERISPVYINATAGTVLLAQINASFGILALNAGDVVDLRVNHDDTVSRNVVYGTAPLIMSWFSGHQIRAA